MRNFLVLLVTIAIGTGAAAQPTFAARKMFCEDIYAKYLKAKVPHKAFATSGGVIPGQTKGDYGCNGTWNTNLAIAMKQALSRCDAVSTKHHDNRKCSIIAKQ